MPDASDEDLDKNLGKMWFDLTDEAKHTRENMRKAVELLKDPELRKKWEEKLKKFDLFLVDDPRPSQSLPPPATFRGARPPLAYLPPLAR